MTVMVAVPEDVRAKALTLIERSEQAEGSTVSPEEIRSLLTSADLSLFRSQILQSLLHGSRVLDAVPEDAVKWRPLVHDSMLVFLDLLSEERLVERLASQASLPRDASRGERILAFIVETPSL
jgi:hypothetical protein